MNNAVDRIPGTDWVAIALWTLIPLVVAAGFVTAALTPSWDSSEWVYGLLALIPLEFVRAIVLSILSETYRDYRSPRYAVKWFLISFLILLVITTLAALRILGFKDFFEAMRNPEIYRAIGIAVALIVVDSIIGLTFFQGDALRLSARLQAAADDARDWLLLGGLEMPVVLAFGYAFLHFLGAAFGFRSSIPVPSADTFRSMCLAYAAFYFLGKATFLAHANTAAFNRTGDRLFGAEWVQWLIWKKSANRETEARNERASARKRRAILTGGTEPASEG